MVGCAGSRGRAAPKGAASERGRGGHGGVGVSFPVVPGVGVPAWRHDVSVLEAQYRVGKDTICRSVDALCAFTHSIDFGPSTSSNQIKGSVAGCCAAALDGATSEHRRRDDSRIELGVRGFILSPGIQGGSFATTLASATLGLATRRVKKLSAIDSASCRRSKLKQASV